MAAALRNSAWPLSYRPETWAKTLTGRSKLSPFAVKRQGRSRYEARNIIKRISSTIESLKELIGEINADDAAALQSCLYG